MGARTLALRLAVEQRAATRELITILRRVTARHFREHRLRLALTVAGIAAAVSMMVAISIINATLRQSIRSETAGLAGSATLQVLPGGATPLPDSSVGVAAATPGVRAAVPVLRVISKLSHRRSSRSVLVFGVPANFAGLFPRGLGEVGRQLTDVAPGRGGLALTSGLASSLGLRVGDVVRLQTPRGVRAVSVGAVLGRNPFAALNGGVFALMSLPASQALFDRPHEVSTVYVASGPRVGVSALRKKLQQRLGRGASVGSPGTEGLAYEQTFNTLAAITEIVRTIGLLVALFLVMNTMAMAVAERRVEVALMLTAGARRRQIVMAFLVEAGILGFIGAAIGVVFGATLADLLVQRAVASYSVLPVTAGGPLTVPLFTLLAGLAGGFYTSVLGAAIPTRQIMKATPIDALRQSDSYEWASERGRRRHRGAAVAGTAAIALSVLAASLLPIGSSEGAFAAAAVLAVGGFLLVLPLIIPVSVRTFTRLVRPLLRPSAKVVTDDLMRSRGRTALTAGGVALAAGFAIAIGTAIGSFRSVATESAARWYQAPLYVNLEGTTSYSINQPQPAAEVKELARSDGVKAVYPMRYGLIDANGHQILIEAMPIAQAAALGDRIMSVLGISRQALTHALGRSEVVISRLTARREKLVPGEVFQVPTTRGLVKLRVGGLFDDLASFDSALIEHSVYERLSGDSQVDRFAVVTRPGADPSSVRRTLEQRLSGQGIAASVLTGGEMVAALAASIGSFFMIAQGVDLVALVVAGLIVLSTMATAVLERRRELGIKRVLGMSKRSLGRAVILEGTFVSAIGAVVAIALGLGLGWLITRSMQNELGWTVEYRPAPSLVLSVVVICACVGAVATLYPAWLATRSHIVDLLCED
jgi:putative ABC transport system permease protein